MRESITSALRGVRYLVHAAADYRLWAPSPADILRNNVEGTRILMEEALRAGVERIVYTSSVATVGLRDGEPADETRVLAAAEAVGAYKKSKVMAERLVDDMVRRAGLPAVTVNPSTPIGPRDVRPTPTGRIIVEAASGRMPAFVDTGLNLVHVDDAAAGHLAALHRGRIGERYILGGENVHLGTMLADIAQSGRAPAAAIAAADRGRLPVRGRRRAMGALEQTGTVRHPRWPADGPPPHVLLGRQGAAGSRATSRGPIARGSRTLSPGSAEPATCADGRYCPTASPRWPPSTKTFWSICRSIGFCRTGTWANRRSMPSALYPVTKTNGTPRASTASATG